MNQDSQKQFVSWLAQKLGAKDENDLKTKMQQMGKDGIKQAYDAFMQEQSQQVQSQKQGGKLEYLQCLQAFKKGGSLAMANCGCDTPKHQAGGNIAVSVPAVTVAPSGTRQFALAHSSIPGQPQQIGQEQLDHLAKVVPNFHQVVGVPVGQEGMIHRFSPEQSDNVRALLARYPMQKSVTAPMIAHSPTPSMAKGGTFASKGYSRNDSSTANWTSAADKRKDKGMSDHTQGSRKDTLAMAHKKADIKDQHKKVEKNPGAKDWMEKGKKTKEHTALTKIAKGKEGMATPAQQKMIELKKKDAAKDRMSKAMQTGGTMTGMVSQPKHKNKAAKPGVQSMM